MKTQTYMKIFLITLLATTALVGCGSSSSSDNGANSLAGADGTAIPQGDAVAYCSQDPTGVIKVEAYSDAYGNLNNSLIRVKLLNAPSSVSSTWGVAFYRLRRDPNAGNIVAQPTTNDLLATYYEAKTSAGYPSGGTQISSSGYTVTMQSDITAIANANGNASATTPASFFNYYDAVVNLNDTSNYYNEILVVYYSGSTITSSTEVLIPIFAADPTVYAQSHPAQQLQNLHPLKAYYGQSLGESVFQAADNNLCY